MASYKRAQTANTIDDVVHRTASWTTTTTTVTSNIPGTTKETAILLLDDDSEPLVQTQPAKKKAREVDAQAKGSFPCGSKKWVRIPDDQIAAYDITACRACPHHPHTSTTVYSLAYFKHDEDGDYECPYGDCVGDVRFVCFMCRKLKA